MNMVQLFHLIEIFFGITLGFSLFLFGYNFLLLLLFRNRYHLMEVSVRLDKSAFSFVAFSTVLGIGSILHSTHACSVFTMLSFLSFGLTIFMCLLYVFINKIRLSLLFSAILKEVSTKESALSDSTPTPLYTFEKTMMLVSKRYKSKQHEENETWKKR